MNVSVRLYLCLACLLVGVIEAPHAMHVLAEDLRGPYVHPDESISFMAARTDPVATSCDGSAEGDVDAFDVDAALVAHSEQR
jgi:hypothetical protein